MGIFYALISSLPQSAREVRPKLSEPHRLPRTLKRRNYWCSAKCHEFRVLCTWVWSVYLLHWVLS